MARPIKTHEVILIHCSIIAAIFGISYGYEKETVEHKVRYRLEQLKAVSNTLALMPKESASLELSKTDPTLHEIELKNIREKAVTELSKVLEVNNLQDHELSLIIKDTEKNEWIRLVSSDPMYAKAEIFSGKTEDLELYATQSHAGIFRADEGVNKYVAYSPVVDKQGKTVGILRLSSSAIGHEISPTLFGKWPMACSGVYLIMLALFSSIRLKKTRINAKEKSSTVLDQELKRKDNELKMLSLVARKSENLMLISDAKGNILWVNETYENKNNYSAEELSTFIGRFLPDVSKNPHIRTILRNVVDFKKSVVYESQSTNEQGKTYFAMTTVTPIKDDQGEVTRLLFVDTDITKVKMVEKENSAYKKFVELSSSPSLILKRTGELIYGNNAAKPLLNKWFTGADRLSENLLTLVQSICDSNSTHSIEYALNERNYRIQFYPDTQAGEIHVLAEEMSHAKIPEL